MTIKIIKIHDKDYHQSITYVNDVKFGDIVDDNSYNNDGYRFHDIIHLFLHKECGISYVYNELINNDLSNRKLSKLEENLVLFIFEYVRLNKPVVIYESIKDILKVMDKDNELNHIVNRCSTWVDVMNYLKVSKNNEEIFV